MSTRIRKRIVLVSPVALPRFVVPQTRLGAPIAIRTKNASIITRLPVLHLLQAFQVQAHLAPPNVRMVLVLHFVKNVVEAWLVSATLAARVLAIHVVNMSGMGCPQA